MFIRFMAVVALMAVTAQAAVDDAAITEVIVDESLTNDQIRATLHVDGGATVAHPTDGLLTCTLFSDNKGSIELARVARTKGYQVDIEYSAPVTDSECWVDTLTLGSSTGGTP